jgi:hypothetical protein
MSSEKSLAQKVNSDGGQWTGGMAARFPDVDCSDVDAKVPKTTISKINGIYQHYGQARRPFIAAFLEAGLWRQPEAEQLRGKILAAAEKIAGEGADGARIRSAYPFALILISGTLAQEFNVLPKTANIKAAVTWAWQRFAASTEAQALDPVQHALANLHRWIAEHWDTAIKKIGSSYHSSRDAFGWYDNDAVYIPTARITEATGGVLSERAVGRRLKDNGHLLRTDTERPSVRDIPGIGRVSAYVLKRSEFGRD